MAQCSSLMTKNLTIQKRRPSLTAAEYFVVVCCESLFLFLFLFLSLFSLSLSLSLSLSFRFPQIFAKPLQLTTHHHYHHHHHHHHSFSLTLSLTLSLSPDMLFYYKLLYVIFPDDRLTLTEINELDKNLTEAIPSSCAFMYMNKVAYVGEHSEKLMHSMSYDCFGMPFNQTAFDLVHFDTNEEFRADYEKRPMEWFASIGNVKLGSTSSKTMKKSSFTIFHNETMSGGRYVPNYDEDTLQKKDPSFIFVPVLTARGASLNYGDNRLVRKF